MLWYHKDARSLDKLSVNFFSCVGLPPQLMSCICVTQFVRNALQCTIDVRLAPARCPSLPSVSRVGVLNLIFPAWARSENLGRLVPGLRSCCGQHQSLPWSNSVHCASVGEAMLCLGRSLQCASVFSWQSVGMCTCPLVGASCARVGPLRYLRCMCDRVNG